MDGRFVHVVFRRVKRFCQRLSSIHVFKESSMFSCWKHIFTASLTTVSTPPGLERSRP